MVEKVMLPAMFSRLMCALFLMAQAGLAQPLIRIAEGTSVTLGTLYESQSTVCELTVENAGGDTLLVQSVRTSCGCTVANLAHDRIPPGRSERLSVTFDAKDIQGDIKREVSIASNDTAHPRLEITFTGTVRTVVQVSPRYISFGEVRLHHSVRRLVQLKNSLADTMRILQAVSPDPQLQLRLADSLLIPHKDVNLEVELSPTVRGKLLGQLELKTTSPLKPLIKISYIGTVR